MFENNSMVTTGFLNSLCRFILTSFKIYLCVCMHAVHAVDQSLLDCHSNMTIHNNNAYNNIIVKSERAQINSSDNTHFGWFYTATIISTFQDVHKKRIKHAHCTSTKPHLGWAGTDSYP